MEGGKYTGGQTNNGVRAVYTLMEGGPRAVFRESNK